MYRTIDTCIWDDPWVSELEPLDKLLFVYLMTNRRSTPCGAFEITLKQISFETGLSQDQARRMLPKLAPKVMWWGEHQIVWIRNFYKHQRANSNAATFAAAAAKKLQDFPPAVRRVVVDEYPELTTEGDDLTTLPPPTPLPLSTVGGKETVTVTVTDTESVEGGARSRPTRARGKKQIPEDFAMTSALRQWAKEKGLRLNLERETEKFVNHYVANGEARANWDASWRNWMLKAVDMLPAGGGYGSNRQNAAEVRPTTISGPDRTGLREALEEHRRATTVA